MDRIEGAVGGILQVRVAARPVGGAANEALIRLLADELRLARTRISIVRGAASRSKLVELDGIAESLVRERWPGLDV